MGTVATFHCDLEPFNHFVCAFQIFGIAARNQWCFSFMEALTWRAQGTCLTGASWQPMETSSWSPWTTGSVCSVSWAHFLQIHMELVSYIRRRCCWTQATLVHICVPLSEAVISKELLQGIWRSNVPPPLWRVLSKWSLSFWQTPATHLRWLQQHWHLTAEGTCEGKSAGGKRGTERDKWWDSQRNADKVTPMLKGKRFPVFT